MVSVYEKRFKKCLTLLSTLSTVEPAVGLKKIAYRKAGTLPFCIYKYTTTLSTLEYSTISRAYKKHTHTVLRTNTKGQRGI
jgi:hypothetical protein